MYPYSAIHIMTSVNSTSCETGTVSPSVVAGTGVGDGPTDVTADGGHCRTGHGATTIASLSTTAVSAVWSRSKTNHHMSTGSTVGLMIDFLVSVHVNVMVGNDTLVAGHLMAHFAATPSCASMV